VTRPRVVLLTEIPAPYRIPLFNALAERVDLKVVFLAARNPQRPYQLHEEEIRFDWEVLPGRDVTVRGRWLVLSRGVLRRLRGSDIVVLGGWNQPAFLLALAWARLARRPVVAWVESTLRDRRSGAGGPAKRLLARACAAFVVPGLAAAEYVRSLAPDTPIVIAPNAVDAGVFAARGAERERLRSELGVTGFCVLSVGRLAPEKGVDVLLRAAAGLPDAHVVVVGSGPEEERLRALASPSTRFVGHVERDDLAQWYAVADVLALPSRSEPWGMTLNEAAAAGLPLVATEAAGAAWDLVEDGVNGFRVPTDDVEALRTALERIAESPGLRAGFGARSRSLSEHFTPAAWAAAVADLATRLSGR
jgi:glycosyltransferase involved in cell wall biosynthesis